VYKYGQGYWVRMMTAVLSGVMFLSCAAWAWGELEKVHIPTPRWQLPLSVVTGTPPSVGQTVTIMKATDAQPTVLGTGVVESFDKEGNRATMRIANVSLNGVANPLDTNRVDIAGATPTATPLFTAKVSQPMGLPLFPRIYLQAGIGALIMALGGWLIYWLVGMKPASVDFLIATDGEMKKVNWSTKKVIRDSTYVVIGATFLIAGIIALSDTLLFKFFQAIGVLGS
jgi:preprotein translocase SecE subunit